MYVYIMTNKEKGILYTGVTSNLIKRIWEHKNHVTDGFTKRYNLNKLVYFEILSDELAAIAREKQIKHWKREWKINLIENNNSHWNDLYDELTR